MRVESGGLRTIDNSERPAILVSADMAAVFRLVRQPSSLRLGEAWMDGSLRLDEGGIFGLVDLVARNALSPKRTTWSRRLMQGAEQRNTERVARHNARRHYAACFWMTICSTTVAGS